MERKRIAGRCAECGEKLTEGDVAYSLLGKTVCPTCVKHGFMICGGESTRDFTPDEIERIYNVISQKTRKGGVER